MMQVHITATSHTRAKELNSSSDCEKGINIINNHFLSWIIFAFFVRVRIVLLMDLDKTFCYEENFHPSDLDNFFSHEENCLPWGRGENAYFRAENGMRNL